MRSLIETHPSTPQMPWRRNMESGRSEARRDQPALARASSPAEVTPATKSNVMQPTEHPRLPELARQIRLSELLTEKLNDLLLNIHDAFKAISHDLHLPEACIQQLSSAHVAHNLRITRRPDGRHVFSFDLREFSLSSQLAVLLIFLAGADDPEKSSPVAARDDSSIVPWRTRPRILAHLQKFSHSTLQPSYVNNVVHKLKVELEKRTGCTLILSGEQGVRLALKRGGVQDLRAPGARG
jgi:hypothetical protein